VANSAAAQNAVSIRGRESVNVDTVDASVRKRMNQSSVAFSFRDSNLSPRKRLTPVGNEFWAAIKKPAVPPGGRLYESLRLSSSLRRLRRRLDLRVQRRAIPSEGRRSASDGSRYAAAWICEFNYSQNWSGREDLNLRPLAPHASALPGCATPRHFCCAQCCASFYLSRNGRKPRDGAMILDANALRNGLREISAAAV
jgi:hypothetical protein